MAAFLYNAKGYVLTYVNLFDRMLGKGTLGAPEWQMVILLHRLVTKAGQHV
jgi:hypothetical protein